MLFCHSVALATAIVFQSVTAVFGRISCFKCTIIPPADKTLQDRICSKFNETALFQVDCLYSTYCMKKTFSLPLLNNKHVVITTRGCAPQKQETQIIRNGARIQQTVIAEESYREGCFDTDNSENLKINSEKICYCKSHLCNGHSKKDATAHTDIMGVIIVYNAIKYVKSFQ